MLTLSAMILYDIPLSLLAEEGQVQLSIHFLLRTTAPCLMRSGGAGSWSFWLWPIYIIAIASFSISLLSLILAPYRSQSQSVLASSRNHFIMVISMLMAATCSAAVPQLDPDTSSLHRQPYEYWKALDLQAAEHDANLSALWDIHRRHLSLHKIVCSNRHCLSIRGKQVLAESWKQQDQGSVIPKVVWRTYAPHQRVPNHVERNFRRFAQGYDVREVSDNACLQQLQTWFEPRVVHSFQHLRGAHRADLWRYAVLYVLGGVYIDMDTRLIMPLEGIFTERHAWYSALQSAYCMDWRCSEQAMYPDSVYQGILATPAGNPLFVVLIERIIGLVDIQLARRNPLAPGWQPPSRMLSELSQWNNSPTDNAAIRARVPLYNHSDVTHHYLDFIRDFYFVLRNHLGIRPQVGKNPALAGFYPVLFGVQCRPGFPNYKHGMCCTVHSARPVENALPRRYATHSATCASTAPKWWGEAVFDLRWPLEYDPTVPKLGEQRAREQADRLHASDGRKPPFGDFAGVKTSLKLQERSVQQHLAKPGPRVVKPGVKRFVQQHLARPGPRVVKPGVKRFVQQHLGRGTQYKHLARPEPRVVQAQGGLETYRKSQLKLQ